MEKQEGHFLYSDKQKRNIFIVFSIPTILVFFLFGTIHLIKQTNLILGFIEVVAALFLTFNFIYGLKTNLLEVSSKRLLFITYILSIIVFISGGTGSDTGNLWILLVPMITVILINDGNSNRWILSLAFILLLIVILHFLEILTLPYSSTDIRSTLIVFILFIILGNYAENIKIQSQKSIDEKNHELLELNQNLEIRIKNAVKESSVKEKLLFEQSKMASMGEMIGNIAHQWRQPLSIISSGATGLLVEKRFGNLSDQQLEKTCNLINDNAQYLSRTIDDFKDFIKGDREIVMFDVKEVIDHFLNLVHSSFKKHSLEVILNIKESIMIKGYPNELIQCFMNIFNNAKDVLQDTDLDNKYIFIETYKENDTVVIKFKDNGGGILTEVLPRIFEPYFTTKHQSQGTGLGLHMTYSLITKGMKGNITVENVTYKHNNIEYSGAEFTISLPME